jgi:GntR family transcriptional regulator
MERHDAVWHTWPLPAYPCSSAAPYGYGMEAPGFELQVGPDYTYVQVARHLEGRIRGGELAPGAQLPNERALAQSYGVALGTMRKAIAILKEKGLVDVTPHKGVFISREE